MMLIKQEFVKETKQFQASTQWLNPSWQCVTTVGVSYRNFEEAVGNMIAQMGASYGSPVVQTFVSSNGDILLQPKF